MDDVNWKRLEVGLKQALQVVCVFKVKVRRGITQCSPSGLEPKPRTSEALTAQYLNVRQRKLGTIIIQTVHILQHDNAVTSYCPRGTFCIPAYFQITQPGSSTEKSKKDRINSSA